MNAHFGPALHQPRWFVGNQTDMYNTWADISPTGAQMPRAVGLAYASVLYRGLEELKAIHEFSKNGNEVDLCEHRQCLHSGGHVLGVGQCHRCAAGARGHHSL